MYEFVVAMAMSNRGYSLGHSLLATHKIGPLIQLYFNLYFSIYRHKNETRDEVLIGERGDHTCGDVYNPTIGADVFVLVCEISGGTAPLRHERVHLPSGHLSTGDESG